MTRASTRGYTEVVRGRYFLASKGEKGKILDEFTRVTNCHRKAAIRLFRLSNQPRADKRHGHPRQYDTICCTPIIVLGAVAPLPLPSYRGAYSSPARGLLGDEQFGAGAWFATANSSRGVQLMRGGSRAPRRILTTRCYGYIIGDKSDEG